MIKANYSSEGFRCQCITEAEGIGLISVLFIVKPLESTESRSESFSRHVEVESSSRRIEQLSNRVVVESCALANDVVVVEGFVA